MVYSKEEIFEFEEEMRFKFTNRFKEFLTKNGTRLNETNKVCLMGCLSDMKNITLQLRNSGCLKEDHIVLHANTMTEIITMDGSGAMYITSTNRTDKPIMLTERFL